MKKVKFNVELTAPNNALVFRLRPFVRTHWNRSMSYPDIIGGDFYDELSKKEKELFELIDFVDLLKHAKTKKISKVDIS